MIKKNAHAKLNLSLDVTGKRENGYHDIKTLMVMTDLCDEMIFSKSERLEIIPEFSFDLKENSHCRWPCWGNFQWSSLSLRPK